MKGPKKSVYQMHNYYLNKTILNIYELKHSYYKIYIISRTKYIPEAPID